MEIRQMEEKREESKEELTRLRKNLPVRRELSRSAGKEQIEEAVKSLKREAQLQEQILDGRRTGSPEAELEQQNARIESCIWSLQMPDRKKNLQGRISNVSKKKSEI